MSHLTLKGRRVLELGGYLASPFAGNILSHLGAEVIKVESPAGDPTRVMRGGTFIAYSAGKKSICIDLGTDDGQRVFEKLLATADIVLHNFSPGGARRFRATREDCHRINPRIVHCHITGYGPGPRQDELASNPVVEAATGVMYANRIDGRPSRMGPSYHDMFAGMQAVIGILAALAGDEGAQRDRFLQVGLYETGLYIAARDLVAVQADNQQASAGNGAPTGEFSHPGYGAYRTADDRWIFLLLLSDSHWERFARVMDFSAAHDPGLATRRQRVVRALEVEAVVREAVAACTWDALIARLESTGLGFTEVKPAERVLDDRQARAPGKVSHFSFDGLRFDVPTFPIVSGATDAAASDAAAMDAAAPVPPPVLGEHTIEILRSLGFSDTECAALRASGAVLATPPRSVP